MLEAILVLAMYAIIIGIIAGIGVLVFKIIWKTIHRR